MRLFFAMLFVASSILGCATQQPLTPEQRLALQPITCSGKVQCDLIWQRAQLWIAQHSRYRIQTVTDVQIQTYGPEDHSVDLAYRAFRESLPNGQAKISFSVICANIFGCVRPPIEAIAELKRYALSVSDGAVPQKLKFGVRMMPVSAQLAATAGMVSPRGAMVVVVEADSPASRAGIQQGDILLRIGDTDVADSAAFQAAIAAVKSGDKVSITVQRGAGEIVLSVQF